MRVFSEQQASLLDLQTARYNLVNYSRVVQNQSQQIQILFKQVEELQKHILNQDQTLLVTQEMLEQMKRAQFGSSSEKRPKDAPLFDVNKEPDSIEETAEKDKKPRKGHGRKSQPELPVIEVIYTLTKEEIEAQGLKPFEGQYEESEIINFYPPRVVIEKSLRQKYVRDVSETSEASVLTAPGPLKLIEKSRYSIDFAIQSGLEKYESHLPLSRQVKRLKELGLTVSEQSLFDQIDLIAWYFKNNVVSKIHASILASKVVQADETRWANLTEKKKFWLWAMTNEIAVGFVIYNSRSQESAENFLKDFKGVLLTDGYQCYKNIQTASRLANDWAHVRRKFIKAESSYPQESQWMVDKIGEVNEIEKQIKGLSPPERLEARQTRSKPLVDEIYEWLLRYKTTILPSGSLGRAIAYTLNLWPGLNVFLSDPSVPITTNLIERLQRDPVIGRKVHYGSRTLRSAQVAADWYTVIGTCNLNGVVPRKYIKYALLEILAARQPVMPWEFKSLTLNSQPEILTA